MTADPSSETIHPTMPYQFDLPEELIALRPAEPKDSARLLVVRPSGTSHHTVRDLPALLAPGDVMVFNETRVLPAALRGVRPARDTHGQDVAVDVNLLEGLGPASWKVLARPGRRLRPGDVIVFTEGFQAMVADHLEHGEIILRFSRSGDDLVEMLFQVGNMPLPPYIARRRAADARDRDDYQTAFARGEARSVAAPTAGLHFTDRSLSELDQAGVRRTQVRLDVGAGTFAPLREDNLVSGRLHEEQCWMSDRTAVELNASRERGRRVVAVGTTSLRTLETVHRANKAFAGFHGVTDIFIRPPGRVTGADALLTNFHLPGSSLFMLVCAFMGTETMQAAYREAIAARYRFFSYGDACLLLPNG